jgi:ribosomal protein S18 acetylase RimI-like enzyme
MGHLAVRAANPGDLGAAARLLHRFNLEYDDPTPGPERLAARLQLLIDDGDVVLIGGTGPDGVAVLRFRPALWSDGLECYLAELYVVPEQRGLGLGRALLEGAIEHARSRGADRMELCTSEDDRIARALYERLGFINREGRDGPLMYFYERDI